jgi:hypothetical protein
MTRSSLDSFSDDLRELCSAAMQAGAGIEQLGAMRAELEKASDLIGRQIATAIDAAKTPALDLISIRSNGKWAGQK